MAACGSGSTLGKEEDLAIISGVLVNINLNLEDTTDIFFLGWGETELCR